MSAIFIPIFNRVFLRGFCVVILVAMSITLRATTEKLTILNTADIHGRIEGRHSGLLKLATLIEQERRTAAPDAVLLIDCGDTIEGTFSSWETRGETVINLLNKLRCNVWVPGNHDFDFGVDILARRIQQFDGIVLAANLHSPPLADKVKKWQMFTLGRTKAKIAVIGMACPQMYDPAICGQPTPEVSAIDQALREIIGEVTQSRPDIIVLAMHIGKYASGFNVYSLLADFPEIDLVLCAHSHQQLPGEKVCGAWLVQSGKHAQELGKIVIEFDGQNRRIIRIRSELLPCDAMMEHPTLKAAVEPIMTKVRQLAAERVGRVKFIDADRHSPELLLGTLAADAMRHAAKKQKPDMAVYSSYQRHTKLRPKMTVSRLMLFNWFRFQDRIGVVTFPGNSYEFDNIIKELTSREKRGYYSIFSGKKLSRRNRIKPHEPDKPLTVVFSSYAISGAGNKFPGLRDFSSKPGRTHMLDKRLRDAVADYLRTNPTVKYRK